MISVAEYSDKSFVVSGPTIDYKNKLKELGGKWNPYLKTGPGWIFSNKRKASVQEWMNTIDKPETVVSPPQKKRKLNNRSDDVKNSVSNSQILKETFIAIFFVCLIYLFNRYNTSNVYRDLSVEFNNLVSLGRVAIQDTYKFYTYTPTTFLNTTC